MSLLVRAIIFLVVLFLTEMNEIIIIKAWLHLPFRIKLIVIEPVRKLWLDKAIEKGKCCQNLSIIFIYNDFCTLKITSGFGKLFFWIYIKVVKWIFYNKMSLNVRHQKCLWTISTLNITNFCMFSESSLQSLERTSDTVLELVTLKLMSVWLQGDKYVKGIMVKYTNISIFWINLTCEHVFCNTEPVLQNCFDSVSHLCIFFFINWFH